MVTHKNSNLNVSEDFVIFWPPSQWSRKPTASSLSADGLPLMASPNFQPSYGNLTVISILRQLADGPKYVPEM
jgi:hypothetical protein